MDTYCEQIVKIKKDLKSYLAVLGIWLLALLISVASFLFLRIISAFIILGVIYGAYYLSSFFSVEYEYIITNGTLDIDIIYAKRSRKRIASFELSGVETIEEYRGDVIDKQRYKKVVTACNLKENGTYKIVINDDKGLSALYISPNDRTKQEIVKFVPKFVGNTAFR